MSGLSNSLVLKIVDFTEVRPLRAKILRPGHPLLDSEYPMDSHPQALHIGAYHEQLLIGVATFYPESSKLFPDAHAYRLRGMAVDSNQQGKGVGKAIILLGEKKIGSKTDVLWFNARESAFPFYVALGYQFGGPMFDIPTIGPHKIMYKFLKK